MEWNSMRLGGPSHGMVTKLYTELDQGMVGVMVHLHCPIRRPIPIKRVQNQ